MPSIIFNSNRNHLDSVAAGKFFPTIKELLAMTLTFTLTTFAWIFFRAENVTHAYQYITKIFTAKLFIIEDFKDDSKLFPIVTFILFFIIIEWLGREKQYAIAELFSKNRLFRWIFYYGLLLIILLYAGLNQQFIYFQF
jgi:hypothetical protein